MITINKANVQQAFEEWETAFRSAPDGFYTAGETAAMEVATVGEGRAIHFMALLRKQESTTAQSTKEP